MYSLLIGFAYVEKTVYPQQARLDRSCLLVVDKYIDRSACITCDGRQGNISVQALSLGKIRVGRHCEIFACHYPRKHY